MPHTDGPMYLNRTATFSVGGGDVLFKFRQIGSGNGRVEVGDGGGWCGANVENPTNEDDDEDVAMEVKLSGNGSLIL